MNKKDDQEEVANTPQKRFVKVAPPTVHAGVGNALRDAFHLDAEMRATERFDDLLNRMS